MPRGVPNAKRDETGMKFTSFSVPLPFNPKHASASYLKSDSQTIWARNAAKKGKASVSEEVGPDQRRGSQVIVIHPGSRFIRIGRASDVNPVQVPCVVARKSRTALQPTERVQLVSRPKATATDESGILDDIQEVDPFDVKLSAITLSLRDRMKFYKLRVTPNATKIALTFNEQFKPERIAEHNDYQTEWIDGNTTDEVLVGEQALRLIDPVASNYMVRWPIYSSNFNTRDYNSLQIVLSDLESIIRNTLSEKMNIREADLKNYSTVLVIPDLYDRAYVREFINLLIYSLGFKQVCAQQESLAATYGAGISNACVVDIGAVSTSIACVDEGLVLPETRMSLSVGGDDITEFLSVLLERIKFPYRELELSRSYDWNVMEDLKIRLCTLADTDVALNLYDFNVRRPNKLTEKYGLRAYDEIILAPMSLFEPRIIRFDEKRANFRPLSQNVTEEILGQQMESITNAMVISTQHLMPAPQQQPETSTSSQPPTDGQPASSKAGSGSQAMDTSADGGLPARPPRPESSSDVPLEVVDGDDENKQDASNPQAAPSITPIPPPPAAPTFPGGFPIDVAFEASKLPLDVAIFNSARAAGGDEKIRKYLQAVLVIGGTALVPGMAHALESRLQAIATPLVPNMEKVTIIPPPKEVDPRVLAWKGAAVLAKMEGVSDLWVTASDWDIFGMRALKERCYHL
ncbi:nucleus protein [Crepidotus variabilis]|uniref:Nucleus protein n=1 Tax=Crepidotus variabilis TaxID=179855 RepID=A0A9P6JM21_9AGAR|nr:nucleus protein [Crepidotus variabilis]